MDKQILELLKQIQDEQREFRQETKDSFTTMLSRLDIIEEKLKGIGFQFKSLTSDRIKDFDFLSDKVNKLEKELYKLKRM